MIIIKVIDKKVLLCLLSYLVADHLIKVKLYTLYNLLQCHIHCNLYVSWHSFYHSFLTTYYRLSNSTFNSNIVMFYIKLIHLYVILICMLVSLDYLQTFFNLIHIISKSIMFLVHIEDKFVSDRLVLNSTVKVSSWSKDLKIDDINLCIDCESNKVCYYA